ncbi:unnamed protein product [Rotaria sp. Silwood1]|nr:unnamed protein product [Rotaria sp. Silwood1]
MPCNPRSMIFDIADTFSMTSSATPVLYALLNDKKAYPYTLLFQALKRAAREMKMNFSPSRIMTDFEKAIKLNKKQMTLTTFWEITFTLDGDYKSYDELVQGALNDDAYQKYFAEIDSEVLLENFKKFVQDSNNRLAKDGVHNGTLYRKENEFYRVYNHEQEVKTLIQFGLNQFTLS